MRSVNLFVQSVCGLGICEMKLNKIRLHGCLESFHPLSFFDRMFLAVECPLQGPGLQKTAEHEGRRQRADPRGLGAGSPGARPPQPGGRRRRRGCRPLAIVSHRRPEQS